MTVANILDEIHDTLDPSVWEKPGDDEPRLRPQHLHWIVNTVRKTLEKHGYERVEDWATLYLSGSLTTYQYSEESDADVSIFVNTERFPEWSRGEMIGVMISEFDGTVMLPGTTHPLQVYVVPAGTRPTDIYTTGLRSAYSLQDDNWVVPPERSRAHDVTAEYRRAYMMALDGADKMELLLQYEPNKAVQYYRQIHRRRMADQTAGKGDYSDSNILYKFLDKRGLSQQAAEVGGFKLSADVHQPLIDVARTIKHCGDYGLLYWHPQEKKVTWVAGDADGPPDGTDLDEIERRFRAIDGVKDVEISDEGGQPDGTVPVGYQDKTSARAPSIVRKWIYHDGTGELHHTEFGPEEGAIPSHYQLAREWGLDNPYADSNVLLGTISPNGWVQTEGGAGNAKARYRAQQAIKDRFGENLQGFMGGEMSDPENLSYEPPTWSFA